MPPEVRHSKGTKLSSVVFLVKNAKPEDNNEEI